MFATVRGAIAETVTDQVLSSLCARACSVAFGQRIVCCCDSFVTPSGADVQPSANTAAQASSSMAHPRKFCPDQEVLLSCIFGRGSRSTLREIATARVQTSFSAGMSKCKSGGADGVNCETGPVAEPNRNCRGGTPIETFSGLLQLSLRSEVSFSEGSGLWRYNVVVVAVFTASRISG